VATPPATGQAGQVSTPAEPADDPRAPAPRRSTGLIVLCVVLGLAAVGCAVWAFGAQSDADDANDQLAAQEQAAQVEASPEPTAAPAASDEDLQQQLDQVAAELGGAGESADELRRQIDAAKGRFDEAESARDDAASAVDRARAELDAFRAKAELAGTCVRGTFEAVSSALDAGGTDAAVTELQQLAGDCRDAVAAE
jgi:uncharacterized protein HemX